MYRLILRELYNLADPRKNIFSPQWAGPSVGVGVGVGEGPSSQVLSPSDGELSLPPSSQASAQTASQLEPMSSATQVDSGSTNGLSRLSDPPMVSMYERIAPLNPADFITSVLVPEAVDRLIQADINEGRVRATKPRAPRQPKSKAVPVRRGTRNRTPDLAQVGSTTRQPATASLPAPAAQAEVFPLFPRGADPATYTVSSTGLPPLTDEQGRVLSPEEEEQAWTALYHAELVPHVNLLQADMVRLQSSVYGVAMFPLA